MFHLLLDFLKMEISWQLSLYPVLYADRAMVTLPDFIFLPFPVVSVWFSALNWIQYLSSGLARSTLSGIIAFSLLKITLLLICHRIYLHSFATVSLCWLLSILFHFNPQAFFCKACLSYIFHWTFSHIWYFTSAFKLCLIAYQSIKIIYL